LRVDDKGVDEKIKDLDSSLPWILKVVIAFVGCKFVVLVLFHERVPLHIGSLKECRDILVQKYWFLSKGMGFSLSNSWSKYLEGWECSNFELGMVLLLWWPNYHVSNVADDIRVCVPTRFKGKLLCCSLYVSIHGNAQIKLLWYVGTMRGENGMTGWTEKREIEIIWPLGDPQFQILMLALKSICRFRNKML
jgi:hypothetical protein